MAYMLDEIRRQPALVQRTITDAYGPTQALAQDMRRRRTAFVYLAGRGTSENAALYGKYLLEIQHGLPVALAAPSVFTLYGSTPRFGPDALVLGISQSGAAPDVTQVVQRAREAGALTACITNEPLSDLAQAAEHCLLIGAGEEHAIAATKTYTGSLAQLALLSTFLDEDHPERIEHLRRVPDALEETLHLDDTVHRLVEKYADMQGCVILGRGFNRATALETALKITETSAIGAHGYSGADFQHGPIAQVYSGFPCLLFAPDGKAFADMAALAEKLRARHPALICFAHDAAFLAASETAVRIPAAVAEWVSPLVYAVAAQLFAYWLCVAKGLDPDAPRGLTKITRTT